MTGKKKKFFVKVTVVVFVAAILIGSFGFYEIRQYNESILDIYAEQQDAYVKLVLDQINLQQDRTDEEIINNILSSLVSSDKKYWTLTKDQDILYVKDVSETNRYKGFTSDSYYLSEGGKEFVDSLQADHVTHAIIYIDNDRYVASGTKFSYLGEEYKICLLTYENVILDNNQLLQTRIMIGIILFALILMLMVVIMAATQLLDKRNEQIDQLKERVVSQNRTIERLEDKLKIESSYNAEDNIFHESVLPKFLLKLEKRQVVPLTMAAYRVQDASVYKKILQQINRQVGRNYLKFTVNPDILLLVFLKEDSQMIEPKLKQVVAEKTRYLGAAVIEDDYNTYESQYEKFRKKVLDNG